jgi:hypothetical protein
LSGSPRRAVAHAKDDDELYSIANGYLILYFDFRISSLKKPVFMNSAYC